MPYKVILTGRLPIKVWASKVDDMTLEQATDLANLPFTCKWIALMPDAHAGYGMPIGGVLAAKDAVIPNAVGVDIGCGVLAFQMKSIYPQDIDRRGLEEIRLKIIKSVPTGFAHQSVEQQWDGFYNAPDIGVIQRELGSAQKQLGTLGGGNHFIEIQSGSDGHLWATIHSGSRNLGFRVAKEYNAIAQKLCKMWHVNLPSNDLAFFPSGTPEFSEYLRAMRYCIDFAYASRLQMMTAVIGAINAVAGPPLIGNIIHVAHNYADIESHYSTNVMVHRKGAVRAREGEWAVIPGSMGSNSYVVRGLGNSESFMSCSHGAGRRMSRKQAITELDLAAEQARLMNVVNGLVSVADLDEAPGAYKDIDTVMADQCDLVEIVTKLTPLMSIKGGAEERG